MGTGPAPVIVPAEAVVGVKLMVSAAAVPLAMSVSPADVAPNVGGSSPLTVMLASPGVVVVFDPAGLLGLLRLMTSLPAWPLITRLSLLMNSSGSCVSTLTWPQSALGVLLKRLAAVE